MRFIEVVEPGSADVLRMAHMPEPVPGDFEVLIKVSAAGVNRPDVFQRMGLYNPPPGASDIIGLEVSGIVVATGSSVSGWRVGDRVCALTNGGGYAEFVCVPATQCLHAPAPLSLVECAALPETCFTVWSNVFDRACLQPGESLLVHGGSSGIGTTAIQMATLLGSSVYTTAGSDEKCRACENLGAVKAINYRTQDFVSELQGITGGRGVDVILDMVGGDYVERNIKVAAMDGRIVNIAYLLGSSVTLNMMLVMIKRLTLTGSTLRAQTSEQKANIAENLRRVVWPAIEARAFKPVISQTFPIEQVADAHRLMESSQHIGKIVLTFDD